MSIHKQSKISNTCSGAREYTSALHEWTNEKSSLFIMFIMSHFFCHLGALKCSDKVIDSLFHTKCLNTHTNEKIIFLNKHCLVSSDLLEVYKDKASFFSK